MKRFFIGAAFRAIQGFRLQKAKTYPLQFLQTASKLAPLLSRPQTLTYTRQNYPFSKFSYHLRIDLWSLVYGLWFMVYGLWFMVFR